MEKLTTSNYATMIGGIGAAILVLVGGWLLYESRLPDLRFEEGKYYHSGDEAVAQLTLTNYGGGDAKDVRITVTFPTPLVKAPMTSSEDGPFTPVNDPVGQERLTGTIKRMVPGETLNVWFAIKAGAAVKREAGKGFIETIKYDGGQAKTGKPTSLWLILWIVFLIAANAFTVVTTRFLSRRISELTKLVVEAREQAAKDNTQLGENNRRLEGTLKQLEEIGKGVEEKNRLLEQAVKQGEEAVRIGIKKK